MNLLMKKAFKDFKSFGWRRYLIILVIFISLGASLSFIYVVMAGDPWVDKYFDDYNHADYVYQFEDDSWINQTDLDGLQTVDEVANYSGRLLWSTNLRLKGIDETKYILFVGLDDSFDDPTVYNYRLDEGKDYNDNGDNLSVVIDLEFAQTNNLELGQNITVDGLNNATLNIAGYITSPEFMQMTSSPEYSIPIKGSIAVCYISKDTLKNYIIDYFIDLNAKTPQDLSSYIYYYQNVDYNSLAVTFKEGINHTDGNNAVLHYFEDNIGISVKKAEAFEDMAAYVDFKDNISKAKSFVTLILGFILSTGIIITYVIFDRFISSQKQQKGMLESYGYSHKELRTYFITLFFRIFLVAMPLSLALAHFMGYVILGEVVGNGINLTTFQIEFVYIPELIPIGVGLGTFMIALSMYLPIRKLREYQVDELIYGKVESIRRLFKLKGTKRKRNPIVSNTLIKRNMSRHKKRIFFMSVAVAFSLLVVAGTSTIIDSIRSNTSTMFKTTDTPNANEQWDLNVNLQNPIDLDISGNQYENISHLDGISKTEGYVKEMITAEGLENRTFTLLGIRANITLMHKFTLDDEIENNRIPLVDDEIVISRSDALALNKTIGDTLSFEFKDTKYNFTIVGIHKEMLSMGYITLRAGQITFHEGNNLIDGIFILVDKGANKQELTDEIYDMGNVQIIFNSERMAEQLMEFYKNFFPLMNMVMYFCLVIALFIVIYNTVMNIYDKNHEYGILRSLGYSRGNILGIVLSENLFQILFPIVLGLMFIEPLSLRLVQIFSSEGSAFSIQIGLQSYLYIVIAPIVLCVLGSLIAFGTIYKNNLYEQVQTRFIG